MGIKLPLRESYGAWVVLSNHRYGPATNPQVLCRCRCGRTQLLVLGSLRRGASTQCEGCRQVGRHGHWRGGKASPTYMSWISMGQRCNNPSAHAYENYGGRGITICEAWSKFENFLKDMGERPSDTTLDRRENNGNYEPANCRWATWVEQANNRREPNAKS